jgi:polyisoprenyl-teichoic acid--peptidoglycan teichoic acid transferase
MRFALTVALWIIGGIAYLVYVGGGLSIGTTAVASTAKTAYASWQVANASKPQSRIAFDPSRGLADYDDIIRQSTMAFIPDWKGTDRISILMLGLDTRDDERAMGLPTRSDTMSVLTVDPVTRTAALISFPRDLWVTIPGFGEHRINEAYPYGELRKVEGGGPGLAARTLEANFGLRVNHYALVNFGGFEDMINMLGGVAIDVPRPIADDTYPTEDYGVQRVYFQAGPQIMDGSTALKYARTRHADSDFGRMARQQQVLKAMADRAMKGNLLARLPYLVEQGGRAIQTDFSPTDLLSLGKLATQIDVGTLTTLEVQYPLVRDFRGYDGAALLLPDRPAIRAAIDRALAPLPTPTPVPQATPVPPIAQAN